MIQVSLFQSIIKAKPRNSSQTSGSLIHWVSIHTCTEEAPDRGLGLSPPGFEFCHFHLTGAVSVDLLSSNDRMYRSECVTPLSTSCEVKIYLLHIFHSKSTFPKFSLVYNSDL